MKTTTEHKAKKTLSIDPGLLRRVDAIAKAETRTRSNMVEVLLGLALSWYEQKRQSATQ